MKIKFALAATTFAIVQSTNAAVISTWNFNNGGTAANVGEGSAEAVATSFQAVRGGAAGDGTRSTNRALRVSNFDSVVTRSGHDGVGFVSSTTGYHGVSLEFWQMVGARASKWAQLEYSVDGGATFTSDGLADEGRYAIAAAGRYQQVSFDLSGIAGVADNAGFQFRLMAIHDEVRNSFTTASGKRYSSTGTQGAWNLDRIVVSGTSGEAPATNDTFIPAPGAVALIGIAGALLVGSRRRG
jgi:hypothetical protein